MVYNIKTFLRCPAGVSFADARVSNVFHAKTNKRRLRHQNLWITGQYPIMAYPLEVNSRKKNGKYHVSLKPLYKPHCTMKQWTDRVTDRKPILTFSIYICLETKKIFSSKCYLQRPLCMLVSYTDNLCKQLGTRSELTKYRS